jgi:hypothetical protein
MCLLVTLAKTEEDYRYFQEPNPGAVASAKALESEDDLYYDEARALTERKEEPEDYVYYDEARGSAKHRTNADAKRNRKR